MNIKALAVGSFSSNPFLCQVEMPLRGCCEAAVIDYIGMEAGKAKGNLLDRCLFQNRLHFDA